MPDALGWMIRIVSPLRMLREAALGRFEELAHRNAGLHAFDDLVENTPHAIVLGLLACRRPTENGTAGEVHLVAGAVAAAVDIEHVALLERAIGAGRTEHHWGFGVKVRAAFDIISQHVFLDRRRGHAATQVLQVPTPGHTADLPGLAHAIDF